MEKQRIEEAKKCDGCLCWHKYCNAECCKSILINVDLKRLYEAEKYLLIKVGNISLSDQYYYKYHGVSYSRGILKFLKENIKIISGKVYYFKDCSMLDENLKCKLHGKMKPKLCRELTIDTCTQTNKFAVTPNCLFKYKLQGGNIHGQKKE